MKKILITGCNGQVGWELQRALTTQALLIPRDRNQLDLGQPDQLICAIREIKPDIILNAAAYTLVDKAEEEQEQAMEINGKAPGILAEEAKRLGALLVHYSTDYVFDGFATQPYCETDPTGPINVYGATKLAGEQAIQSVGGAYLIFRTSWVYGTRGKNFLLTMLRLAEEKPVLKVVADQVGAPTWSRLIAEATVHALRTWAEQSIPSGVYHLTSGGATSWHGFAEAIFKNREKAPQILKISSAEYPTTAKRPSYSVLNHQKFLTTFNFPLPHWQESLGIASSSR